MSKVTPYTLKKSLGQHFLRDEQVSRKMIAAMQENPFSHLLEVGPGGGALTKHLLELSGIEFLAVEVDEEKFVYLQQNYPALEGKLLHQDFLRMEPPFPGRFTMVGNFPYNISSQILFKAIDWKEQVECVVGMFQKEVAQRVAAGPGSKVYGVTSVLVQAYFSVEYLFDVPPSSFNPPPKVMSGVIRLLPKRPFTGGAESLDPGEKNRCTPPMASERQFKILVKTAFNQRRKQLRNAVKSLFAPGILQDELFTRRAEELSIEEFAALTFKM